MTLLNHISTAKRGFTSSTDGYQQFCEQKYQGSSLRPFLRPQKPHFSQGLFTNLSESVLRAALIRPRVSPGPPHGHLHLQDGSRPASPTGGRGRNRLKWEKAHIEGKLSQQTGAATLPDASAWANANKVCSKLSPQGYSRSTAVQRCGTCGPVCLISDDRSSENQTLASTELPSLGGSRVDSTQPI